MPGCAVTLSSGVAGAADGRAGVELSGGTASLLIVLGD